MLRAFVFTLTSAEKPLSHVYVTENGSRTLIATLLTLLCTRTYLSQKSLKDTVSKLSLATEMHFISKNSSYILSGRTPASTQKEAARSETIDSLQPRRPYSVPMMLFVCTVQVAFLGKKIINLSVYPNHKAEKVLRVVACFKMRLFWFFNATGTKLLMQHGFCLDQQFCALLVS